MIHLLKWAVSAYKLLSITVIDKRVPYIFKIVLILLLLEAGDIERNTEPYTSNNSLSILHCSIRRVHNKLDYITENLFFVLKRISFWCLHKYRISDYVLQIWYSF